MNILFNFLTQKKITHTQKIKNFLFRIFFLYITKFFCFDSPKICLAIIPSRPFFKINQKNTVTSATKTNLNIK
jgi:hypothetical protein